jgi:hypothetical protein
LPSPKVPGKSCFGACLQAGRLELVPGRLETRRVPSFVNMGTARAVADDLATQVTSRRPAERAYRRTLALFLGVLVASAVPAFLSAGVDLLDPPIAIVAPVTAIFMVVGLVRARAAATELRTRAPRRRVLHVVMLHATALLFAGLGGATLAWETTRFLDARLDRAPTTPAVARRVDVRAKGDETRATYRIEGPSGEAELVVVGADPPETLDVDVHPGALGYRWVAR